MHCIHTCYISLERYNIPKRWRKGKQMTFDIQERILSNNKSLVRDYFRRVKSGDLLGLSNLLSDDSVIYEPFSKLKCITGKSAIESFLRTVVMKYRITTRNKNWKKRTKSKWKQYRCFGHVYKGDSITGRLCLNSPPDEFNRGRIKTLTIEFTD